MKLYNEYFKLTEEEIEKYATEDEKRLLEKYKKPDGYADAINRKKKKNPKSVADKAKYASEWLRGKEELLKRKKEKDAKKEEINKLEQEIDDLKSNKKSKKKKVKENVEYKIIL